ncbi:flagellar type III secretion system protein FlhB [Verticiella sediminum]|uniref:Flagellar biosynthetic protein FlhB n=1 Tax=Verticiella sediminum TaxID=1247510 RepID=A0A556ARV4_9BURK|nr:flagellar biosynthesis protein FlhB [Verticiella sediminum]TSH95691.1 flagellar type III secretion system protein FlhB [Verticiella sediminum]
MAEESDLEKTEPASERRLEKAREEGQTPRSRELVTFLLLLSGVGMLYLGAAPLYEALRGVLRGSLDFDVRVAFDTAAMLQGAGTVAWRALLAMLPLFGILAVVAIGASVALGGLLLVGKPLVPDLNRLNPVKGLARIFSANTLIELAKALTKAALVGSVATFAIYKLLDEMLVLMHVAASAALAKSLSLVALCCAIVIASLVVIAMFDAPYQVWSHLKKLRMSRQDVKQEHKESDGDPHLKARIRQQQRQMARGRMMSAVPTADVVLTNPTHYAVALKYEEGRASAPRVVAKGTGLIAQRIRELAAEHRVPLLSAPPLARALHRHVELDAEIPVALYAAVAEVLAWVFQLRTWRAQGGIEPGRPSGIAVPPALDPQSTAS